MIILLVTGIATAGDEFFGRVCVVKEILAVSDNGYIRCREGNDEYWVGGMRSYGSTKVGDRISFLDSAPMVNFKPKNLDRTFPRIYFVEGISILREDYKELRPTPANVSSAPDFAGLSDTEGTYKWEAEDGSVVLTDDVARMPKEKLEKRFKRQKKPRYVMFVSQEQYFGHKLRAFYDANNINNVAEHKMVIVHSLLQPRGQQDESYQKKEMYYDVDCYSQTVKPIDIVDAGEAFIGAYKNTSGKVSQEKEFHSVAESLYAVVCK